MVQLVSVRLNICALFLLEVIIQEKLIPISINMPRITYTPHSLVYNKLIQLEVSCGSGSIYHKWNNLRICKKLEYKLPYYKVVNAVELSDNKSKFLNPSPSTKN